MLARAGYAIELPRLPGHGTAVGDLVPMRWADWCAAAEVSYAYLAARCERVVVVGLSMGGALACRLAERHAEIAGLVLVNPIVTPVADDLRTAAADLLSGGMELAPGLGDDIARPDTTELAYGDMPLAPLLSLFTGLETEVRPDLGRIACPVLLFSSREDHVVDPANGDLVEASVGGPVERVRLERSYHVATLDWDRPLIEARVEAFVRDHAAEPVFHGGGVG